MTSFEVLAPESSRAEDESSLNLSTSSSLSESSKEMSCGRKLAADSKALQAARRNIGKQMQLISAQKEKITQLKEECVGLRAKEAKLGEVVKELQVEKVRPGKCSKLIAEAKRTSVRLLGEIAELKSTLTDFPATQQAVQETAQELAYLQGNHLDSLSLAQCQVLFTAKCQALQRINSALLQKAASQTELDLCIVCVNATRSVVLVPCGHLVLCTACSLCVQVCPVCRAAISERFPSGW